MLESAPRLLGVSTSRVGGVAAAAAEVVCSAGGWEPCSILHRHQPFAEDPPPSPSIDLVALEDTSGAAEHVIAITGGLIFDANKRHATALSPFALDGACVGGTRFARVAHAIRLTPTATRAAQAEAEAEAEAAAEPDEEAQAAAMEAEAGRARAGDAARAAAMVVGGAAPPCYPCATTQGRLQQHSMDQGRHQAQVPVVRVRKPLQRRRL